MVAASELAIDTGANDMEMAHAMFGNGITIVSADYSGNNHASGIYSGAETTMPGVAPSDDGVILSTGRAKDITNSKGEANQSTKTSTNLKGAVDNDADLNEVAGMRTYDGSIFEAEFVPDGAVLSMQLTFSSEEYLEWVDSGYNDAVGIWVNGEKAELTVGDSEISIDTINPDSNPDWYIDNANDEHNTEMDGFTITLTLTAPVNPGEVNEIKIGIADAGDSSYDSNLMIAGNSIQTVIVAEDDEIDIMADGSANFDVLANDSTSAGGTLTITHVNGQPVSAGDTITLANGVELTLNADGTFDVQADDEESETTFIYSVEDDMGNVSSGYATVNTVPCFTTGTMIDTARGPLPVEELLPGDLVLTRDHGFQQLRWAGQRHCTTSPVTAPIEIEKGALGDHGRLLVSPQHRVLVSNPRAQLLFASNEVLVTAQHLVNGHTIQRAKPGGKIGYVHLLFDQHEVLRSNGIWTESYLPGPETRDGFSEAVQQEIVTLFPEIDPQTGLGYGPAARLCLRQFQAQALSAI